MTFRAFYKKIPGRVRNRIEYFIKRVDHGEFFSLKLRSLYKKVYNIEVGKGSYGCFDVMQFPEGTRIGNYCSIAPRVYFLFSNHPMDGVSTHPLFYNKILGYVEEDRIERVRLTVENDVWIGAGVTITRGCTHIANGAVIGAGSVVTHDIPPYAVVAGNPARVLRYRFGKDVQSALEESKWYELDPEMLAHFIDDADDPMTFAEKVMVYRKGSRIETCKRD